jgi:FtsP/CotA-like multicopper oxidase with cupredoxin domain
MSINPADLMPYREQLPQPVRRDLRKQGLVCQETVEIKYANKVRYSSQLSATSAWAYEGDVPGPLIIVDDNQTVQVEWRNTIAAAQTPPFQVVVFPNPAGEVDGMPHPAHPGG